MRPKHVGLVFCVSLVGCMVTFGVGFIVGMGYKASEQIQPYAVIKTPGGESVMQGRIANAALNDGDMTFYDSLTDINKVPMVTNEPPEPESLASGPARTPIPASPFWARGRKWKPPRDLQMKVSPQSTGPGNQPRLLLNRPPRRGTPMWSRRRWVVPVLRLCAL